jgi:hypothetical protein
MNLPLPLCEVFTWLPTDPPVRPIRPERSSGDLPDGHHPVFRSPAEMPLMVAARA